MDAAFDLLVAAALLALAWRILHAPELFEAVAVFITFGLLAAIAWARLAAPDIALAEAAIGAGLTGVLLLETFAALSRRRAPAGNGTHLSTEFSRYPALLGVSLLAALLIWVVLTLPRGQSGLTAHVAAELPRSGVSHPVTAVLLNFRGYDTWLEVGVLIIAVIGVLSMRGGESLGASPARATAGPLLAWLVRWLAPVMALIAGYLLWLGKFAAGGAFQSGVVLGAGGVLLWLAGFRPLQRDSVWRLLLALGFTSFLLVALGLFTAGKLLLQFPEAWAGELIMLIEICVAVSISATMAALCIGLNFPAASQPQR